MRILMVCGAGRLFGKEMVTLSLMEGLRNRGHEVRCITSTWKDGRFEERLTGLSIPYTAVPLGFISKTVSPSALRMTFAQAVKLPVLWHRYRKAIQSFRPNIVVHSAFHHVFLLWPLFGSEINVFHVHDAFAPTSFYRRLFKILNRRMTAFVGVSRFVADTLITLGVPSGKICYVLNGISVDESRPAADARKSDHQATSVKSSMRIGIVGQVDAWKGHEDLIDALRILDQKGASFSCRIFGTGSAEFMAELKARIEEYDLTEKVEWMGFVNERKAIYQDLDVCVVPSRINEAFGMVAAEASMFGIPVIASRMGALPEIIQNGHTGYLVDAGSPDQIAEKIGALSLPTAQRIEMGQKAVAHVLEALGAKMMIDKMENLFESLIAEKAIISEKVD